MRILAAIANYGTGNRQYLDRLIAEYHSMPWDVDVVVISNIPKTISPRVEVRVGLPDKDPWSLPFAHRSLFAERRNDYDLFIYSEDDTLVRTANIEAYIEASRILRPNEIPGFMRTETDTDGKTYVSSMHGYYRWVPAELIARGSELFAPFTNDHAACYFITREQLAGAIVSGGFLVAPYEGRYDMLCTASTDVYTRCGLKRYLCISRLAAFLLPHLPNKYIGRMGISLQEVDAQVEALKRIASNGDRRGPLFDVDSGLRHGEWSKDLYERPDPDLVKLIPSTTRRLLSVGCGWGETEAALAARGMDVTAIPVDPVFGDALRRRGIQTVEGSLTDAVGRLEPESFDCVLLADVLHLVDDPVAWLTTLRRVVKEKTGSLVLSVPNTGDIVTRLKGSIAASASGRGNNGHRYLQPAGAWRVRSWLRAAGYAASEFRSFLSPKRELAAKATLGTLRTVLAQRFIIRARVR
jgi:SAM-dependent methyltransferase